LSVSQVNLKYTRTPTGKKHRRNLTKEGSEPILRSQKKATDGYSSPTRYHDERERPLEGTKISSRTTGKSRKVTPPGRLDGVWRYRY